MSTWVRGSIASEPALPFRGSLPVFAIDARTRPGMSGAPVMSAQLNHFFPNGHDTAERVFNPYLVGIYSGRLNVECDIGLVWHKSVIAEIIDAAQSPDAVEMTRTRKSRW